MKSTECLEQLIGEIAELERLREHLWVVGKATNVDHGAWELQGVFSSEERALAAAVGAHDFIRKIQLDREQPRRTVAWPEAWYPNLEDRPGGEGDGEVELVGQLTAVRGQRDALMVEIERLRAARTELVTALHDIASHFENALYAFRDDAEARKKAEGDIAHAMKIAARHNHNGREALGNE